MSMTFANGLSCAEYLDWSERTVRHQLAGRMFEDEYDLAIAVMEGIEERSQRRGYSTERF